MENLPTDQANRALQIISRFSTYINKQNSFSVIVELMAMMAKELVDGDRSTIWLYDSYKDEFWTRLSDGIEKARIQAKNGTVGEAVRQRKPIIVNDPYSFANFNPEIDNRTGYKTKCIITCPVFNGENNLIAVFQVINKHERSMSQKFNQSDLDLLQIAASLGGKILLGENFQEENQYNKEAQELAFGKQKTAVRNQLEDDLDFNIKILYKPADVLTGDIYSLYKKENGDVLAFVVDAMGHGIMPALTSYSIASRVRQYISKTNSLEELAQILNEGFKNILIEEEQVSCFFFWFNKEFSKVSYFGAGMYPPFIKTAKEIFSIKSNNFPFMNFTPKIKISSLDLEDFQSLFIYSDGLVEDENHGIDKNSVTKMFQQEFYEKVTDRISKNSMEDDTTLLLLEKRSLSN